MDFLLNLDLPALIQTVGILGVFAIIFAESGLLIGLFLPGDSLLFTAGFLASQGYLDIAFLLLASFLGAVLGDSVGYAFGRQVGPRIFTRENSRFFHKEHLAKAKIFYERHGGKAIILARFMPVIRTLAPILAGVGKMRYAAFLFYNIIGGVLWAVGITLLGYWLGKSVPDIDRYLVPVVLAIIILTSLPTLFEIFRDKRNREYLKNFFLRRKTRP